MLHYVPAARSRTLIVPSMIINKNFAEFELCLAIVEISLSASSLCIQLNAAAYIMLE